MNQINPLYIGIFLVMLIAFLFFKLTGIKEELVQANTAYKKSEKMAVDLSALKVVYANKKRIKKSIERLLAQPSIRKAKLTVKRGKNSIFISSKSINARTLNSLMSKVLNGSYNIAILKIKRNNATSAAIKMEIKW